MKFGPFYCSAEWHLARLGPKCALVYVLALRLSRNSGKFAASAASIAEYFGFGVRSAQRAFRELREAGFFELVESGKASFEPSIYRVLRHEEWAKRNSGKCTEKLEYAWTKEGDALSQKLWAASGCQAKFTSFRMNMLRCTGIPEPKLIELFESWYPKHKAAQKGRKWRRSVSYHFAMYVRALDS